MSGQALPGVKCPHCGVLMTCSYDDIEMILEARVIIGDWRCENGHVQRIVGVIEVVDDEAQDRPLNTCAVHPVL